MSKMRQLDSPQKKRQLLLVKVSFLVLVGLLIGAMQLYLANRPISPPPLNPNKPVAKNQSNILGARTQKDLVDTLTAELENIKKQLTPLSETLSGEAMQFGESSVKQGQQFLTETAGDVTGSAIDSAVSAIIEPIITQIQNLPEKEQNQIKEAICR